MIPHPQQFLPWLFPRLLGAVYFLAFASLLVQARGLFGSGGILPIQAYLSALRKEGGGKIDLILCPSIFWLNSSDGALVGAAIIGELLAILLMVGAPPVPLLVLLWLLYLSFVSAGQEFLAYQWDTLLLETGFMSIFLPLVAPSPPVAVFAYRFFLVRFMFSSGVVKLMSGDPTWRNLTAMTHHYQTQPIPNRVSWYAHNLPAAWQEASTLGTLVLELLVPLLALGPEPARLACVVLLALLQLLIYTTGNYGFFNILTVLLTLPLLDDRVVGRLAPLPHATSSPAAAVAIGVVFGIFLVLNLGQLLLFIYRPRGLVRCYAWISPFMISNHYGLFAVMTTERFELVLEGSMDQQEWKEYEFRWKPGDPKRAPRQAAPHMPRLDWQMWFAALEPSHLEPWLQHLVLRLLQGSREATFLIGGNPFPEAPPTFIRVTVYRYRFTDRTTRRREGLWWERSLIGRFPPMRLPAPPHP